MNVDPTDMVPSSTPYVIVTPVRDEQEYLPLTIESVIQQTNRPREWVIVNDGSSDQTGAIIDEYAGRHSWIRAVHCEDRGYRKWGAGIIEAFYAGFHALSFQEWKFMCKLDGDLSFDPEYFEGTFRKFEQQPRLGIGGGFLYHLQGGEKIIEEHPTFHVRGGAKIYRRECWDELGGLWVGPGSDTVDEVKANMLGWNTMSFMDLQMRHHRWTGAAYGRWGGIVKNGKTDYVSGYHPLFVLAKAAARLFKPPYFMGALALVYGYLSAQLKNIPRVDDPDLIRYLRQQQMNKLAGKETIWR